MDCASSAFISNSCGSACRQADTPDTESGAQEDEEAICRLILLGGKTLLLRLSMSLRIHPRNTMHTSAKVAQKERERERKNGMGNWYGKSKATKDETGRSREESPDGMKQFWFYYS
jgi:hypothetical protein